jgi:hypothetical protein
LRLIAQSHLFHYGGDTACRQIMQLAEKFEIVLRGVALIEQIVGEEHADVCTRCRRRLMNVLSVERHPAAAGRDNAAQQADQE